MSTLSDLPSPPALENVEWRPAVHGDAAAIARLEESCFAVDHTYREVEAEVLERFVDPGVDSGADSWLGVTWTGEVVASVWTFVPPTTGTKWRGFGSIHVHPDWRSDEVIDYTIDWWTARLAQRLEPLDASLPKMLWYPEYAHRKDMIQRFLARGHVISRYFDELIRDLSDPIEPHPMPIGIDVVPADEAAAGDELAVHNEAFRDHWGSQPFTQERWDLFRNEFYLPDASWVAYDQGVPIAHIMCATWPHDYADRGFSHAWIDGIGVVRSHRRTGVASALITLAMERFRDVGLEYAMLEADSENPTGAYRVYERLGFRRTPDRSTVALTRTV